MKKVAFLLIFAFMVASCDKQSIPKVSTNSSEITAQTQNNHDILNNQGKVISNTSSIEKMASDQSETDNDRKITRAIRRALLADDTFTNFENDIKISTIDGVVTLRGYVTSKKEKNEIIKKLASIRGITRVESQLIISQ